MPHGKKNGKKRVNPKKQRAKSSSSQVPSPTSVCDARPTLSFSPGQARSAPDPPSCRLFRNHDEADKQKTPPFLKADSEKQPPRLDSANDSVYVRYKKSTQRIKTALQSMVPPAIFESDSVNAFMDATDYIVENDMEVNKELLSNLKFSIRVRKRFAEEKHGRCDEGHSHFIAVLVYCWSLLAPRQKQQLHSTRASTDEEESDVTVLCNRFEGLCAVDDTDESDDENDMPDGPQLRPEESTLTLEELIEGSDITNIILFLTSIDELMDSVASRFKRLNESTASLMEQPDRPASTLVEEIMEASVTTNFAIQQVEALEETFVRDYPHLNTLYRAFAHFLLPEIAFQLVSIVSQKSPLAAHFSEKDAFEFLGDVMECAFRGPSQLDPYNKTDSLVPEFLKRWQFHDDAPVTALEGRVLLVQRLFDAIHGLALFEAPLNFEECDGLKVVKDGTRAWSHMWLRAWPNIGGDRSMTHTIRCVQMLSSMAKTYDGKFAAHKGGFGACWSGRKEPATQIQGEMESLLLGIILPSLINLGSDAMLSKETPHQEDLFTGLAQFQRFAQFPERPVSWALAFTVHAILVAIFELQEPDRLAFLSETARHSFEKFFGQVEWVAGKRGDAILQCPAVRAVERQIHLTRLCALETMARTREHTMLALWNPYCAGTFLSYAAYYANLEGGTLLLDNDGQLRVTLHLFNTLKQTRAVEPGQIELLDRIFKHFKDCQAVWGGQLPVQGRLQTRFWISSGMSEEWARKMHGRGWTIPPLEVIPMRPKTRIDAEEVSRSYGRICLCDVRGDGDQSSASGQQRKKRRHLSAFTSRTHSTLRSMSDDEPLLATNLITLGFHLNQFFLLLVNEFDLMPIAEMMVEVAPPGFKSGLSERDLMYKCMSVQFAHKVLGPVDSGDKLVASWCAELMEAFYNGIDPGMDLWFAPKEKVGSRVPSA